MSDDARVPRWMRLAMPDDVAQIAAMVDLEYRTPAQRASSANTQSAVPLDIAV